MTASVYRFSASRYASTSGSSRFRSQKYSSIRVSPWIVVARGTARATGGSAAMPPTGETWFSPRVPETGASEGMVRLGVLDMATLSILQAGRAPDGAFSEGAGAAQRGITAGESAKSRFI